MELIDIFCSVTDIDKKDVITTSPSFRELQEKYYATMRGYCEACVREDTCRIKHSLDKLDSADLKKDVVEFSKTNSSGALPSDFNIQIIVTKCNAFSQKIN